MQIQKTRQSWSIEEDQQLKIFLQFHGTTRKGWKETSKGMKSLGFERSTKACRERYNYHIDQNSNSELTEQEMSHLFSLIEIYGNKWSEIAKIMGNRTDLKIKNSFYDHVKRISRRLIKSAFKTKASTQQTKQIRPIFISSIFCNETSTNIIPIDKDVKQTFKQLIVQNQSIKLGAELNQQTIEQVKFVMDYLGKENANYLEKLSEKKENKIQNKIKHQIQKSSESYSTMEQDVQGPLLLRIKARKPIFTTNKYRIERHYEINDELISDKIYPYAIDCQQSGITQQNQMFSQNLSFYFVQSNQTQQYAYYLDSFNSQQNQLI